MKRLISASLTVFCFFCLLMATDRRAYAYVNPGDGLLALQSAAAVLATIGYSMRRRIAVLFSGSKGADKKHAAKVVLSSTVVQKDDSRNAA